MLCCPLIHVLQKKSYGCFFLCVKIYISKAKSRVRVCSYAVGKVEGTEGYIFTLENSKNG